MKVSVILVTRDTRDMTVANARRAAEAGADELIVVDNGSNDGTAEALAREVPSARVIPAGANLGFGRAANLGARASSGELILFLNSDAELTAAALKGLRATFMSHPGAGAVGAFLLDPDGTPQRSVDGVPTLASELLGKALLRALRPDLFPSVPAGAPPTPVPTLVGACMAVTREAFDSVGGFDERFFFFMEETDLCLRLRRRSWEVLVAPGARVVHGQGKTARRTLPRARVEYDLSRYRFFRKHYGRASAALLWAGTLLRVAGGCLLNGLGMILTLGFYARWRDKATVQGYRLAWHGMLCPPGWGLEPEGGIPVPTPTEKVVAP